MPITMELWQISKDQLVPLSKTKLDLERQLETWIEQDIGLIGLDALIVGRQVRTGYGGYIDLLAINGEGELVIIELKRSKTPRDIVAQCIDYGSWVHDLGFEDVADIYGSSYAGQAFDQAFAEYFERPVPEKINTAYQIIIVAESLDESTERIVQHLNDVHRVNINAVFFNVFLCEGKEFIGRSWLKDPVEVEEKTVSGGRSQQWTGYYFVNSGITDDGGARDWDLNRKYGFVSAGGGLRWINAIKKLKKGDKVFALIKGKGYVGYGVVEEGAVLVKDFEVNRTLLLDRLPEGHPWKQPKDPSKDEWLAKVSWVKVVDEDDAQWFKGAFANQNVVCKLRDQNTFKFLVDKFGVDVSE